MNLLKRLKNLWRLSAYSKNEMEYIPLHDINTIDEIITFKKAEIIRKKVDPIDEILNEQN